MHSAFGNMTCSISEELSVQNGVPAVPELLPQTVHWNAFPPAAKPTHWPPHQKLGVEYFTFILGGTNLKFVIMNVVICVAGTRGPISKTVRICIPKVYRNVS